MQVVQVYNFTAHECVLRALSDKSLPLRNNRLRQGAWKNAIYRRNNSNALVGACWHRKNCSLSLVYRVKSSYDNNCCRVASSLKWHFPCCFFLSAVAAFGSRTGGASPCDRGRPGRRNHCSRSTDRRWRRWGWRIEP